ncbi:MAG: ArsA family ATPase [Acidobacteriota bacterium]
MAHSPLTVFCGKGGVGKTTLSLAFGLAQASRGRRVVVVTSHPLEELAVTVSLHGLAERLPQAAENLFVIHIDPRELLARRVRQQLPSLLASAVLSNRIYQGLVEVAPGLKEVAFLARLRDLASGSQLEEQQFDLLVWDAPATGHFLQTIRVARNFDTYLTGPFAIIGRELIEFFSNPEALNVIPVTTLEQMAVEETLELFDKLTNDLQIVPTALVCNLVSPLLAAPAAELENLKEFAGSMQGPSDLEFILKRHDFERELFEKVSATASRPCYPVERVQGVLPDLDLLVAVSEQLTGIL